MKKGILWLAVACLLALAVWAWLTGGRRHETQILPTEKRVDEADGVGGAQGVPGRGEGSAAGLPESENGGTENGPSQTGSLGRGRKGGASGDQPWDQDEWNSEPATEFEGLAMEEAAIREIEERNERSRTLGPTGLGRGSGVEGNVVAENGGMAKSFAVSEDDAERIFAANEAAADAARELRREAAKEDEKEEKEELDSKPPLRIARRLIWNDETQEMEVSFKFGAAGIAPGGDAATGGVVENGILVQRIPPGWEVESSSPAADAFAAGSRKLKWLLSGGAVVGREISLRATPVSAGADPGDWDLAATWFTCRWDGKACLVQPEIGRE